jgi:hypothetical protein
VYPVLLADCAFSQCHGAEQRFFRVFGPGRAPLKDASGSESAVLEMQASYVRALSMLITDGSRPLSESPLLTKPLDLGAGGSAHGGEDVFGRNVYHSTIDPNYVLLLNWASGARPPEAIAGGGGAPAPSGNSVLVSGAGSGGLNASVPTQTSAGAASVSDITAGAQP